MADGNIYDKPIYHIFLACRIPYEDDCEVDHIECDTWQAVLENVAKHGSWDTRVVFGHLVRVDPDQIQVIRDQWREAAKVKDRELQEERDRAEYARLKEKYENG